MNLDVWMRIRSVQPRASTGLGPRVEMQMVSAGGQVERVLLADAIVWYTVVTGLENGSAVRVHHGILLWCDGRSGLQVVS